MASILHGFNYDIFISYRQKDNKGEKWVSEFVNALRTELEATLKEDVSVYYDENPHDGLLETDDVDASLREKLKCLIFIPVISHTYCDPKSFAWEHEFKPFVEQATGDQFGLKITLANGNVANRILPVRIHELDNADTRLCESLVGGVLRGVDFIYKSAGVNRPLRANEDHPQDNLNRTYYRDQINKVANAINEILRSLTGGTDGSEKILKERKETVNENIKTFFVTKKTKRRFVVSLSVIFCILFAYIIYKSVHADKSEVTLAFIPLRASNNDTVLKIVADYFIEALHDKFGNVKSISRIPNISSLRFKNTEEPLDKIRKELETKYLIDGNIRRDENNIKIWIELSGGEKNEKTIWSKSFDWDKKQVSQLTREIVQAVATQLNVKVTDDELKLLSSEPSKNANANLNYISANLLSYDAWGYVNYGSKLLDSVSYRSAIETYDKVIEEDSSFAQAYAKRAIAISWGIYVSQFDSSYIIKCKKDIDKAMSINKDLIDNQIALGFYYYFCNINYDKALFYFQQAAAKDPGNYQPIYYQSLVYRRIGKWKESMDLIHRVIHFNPQEALFLTNIGSSYEYMHDFDSALIYHQKAIDLVPGWPDSYKNKIETLILKTGKTSEARTVVDAAIKNTGDNMFENRILLNMYEGKFKEALEVAEKSSTNDYDVNVKGNRYLYLAEILKGLKRPDDAKIYYDSARISLTIDVNQQSRNPKIHSLLGIAYAGLGNKIKAISEGEKAITMSVKDNMTECDVRVRRVQILTMVGEYDNAIAEMAYLLNSQSAFSEKELMLDPIWKPLTDRPEFKSNLRKYFKF